MSPTLPNSYKAAVFEGKDGKPVLKDVDLKLPDKGRILVKVLACGVCHSDEFLRIGALGDVFPRVPGHEIVGDIVAVGQDVVRFKEGDRVGGAWHGGTQFIWGSAVPFSLSPPSPLPLRDGVTFATSPLASLPRQVLTCIVYFLQAMTEPAGRANAVSSKLVSTSKSTASQWMADMPSM